MRWLTVLYVASASFALIATVAHVRMLNFAQRGRPLRVPTALLPVVDGRIGHPAYVVAWAAGAALVLAHGLPQGSSFGIASVAALAMLIALIVATYGTFLFRELAGAHERGASDAEYASIALRVALLGIAVLVMASPIVVSAALRGL
jgi:hypothetical protein